MLRRSVSGITSQVKVAAANGATVTQTPLTAMLSPMRDAVERRAPAERQAVGGAAEADLLDAADLFDDAGEHQTRSGVQGDGRQARRVRRLGIRARGRRQMTGGGGHIGGHEEV